MIDSGSGSSWIAKDILPNINYTLIGHKQLRVRTFGQEIENRFKIVQIYFENHNTKYAVKCYVIENFLKHILVKGLKDYLRKNTQLSPQVVSRVVDPTKSEIDHKDINEGTGLVLSNEDACLITKESNSRLCLKDKRLIFDDTYFGIAVSGKVPNCLLRDTHTVQANWAIPRIINSDEPQNLWMYPTNIQGEVEIETIDGCQASSQSCALEDQLKILDKEHLGNSKSWGHATPWIMQEDWRREENEFKLHPHITDFNSVHQEEVNSLLEECFNNTSGDFHDKLGKYSLYTREYIQNTEKTAIKFRSEPPDSELKGNVNTVTPSIYLSEDTNITEKYVTESGGNDNTTRENCIKMKPVTHSTEIMDFSTLIQNKDSKIHDTTIIHTFSVNSLNIDFTQYINYNHAREQYYSMNNNESEYTLINANTTTKIYIMNLSENDTDVSTAKEMDFEENENGLYHSSTTSQDNKRTSTNEPIYSIDTGSNELSKESLINLSEDVTTEDKVTLITENLTPDPLNNISDSLVDYYSSHLIEIDTSTFSQEYISTTEGECFELFDFFRLFDISKYKMTTLTVFNFLVVNESTFTVVDPSTKTDSSLSVIINNDGYIVKESRFYIPEDILLTKEQLLGNNDTSIILEKETSLDNKDRTLSLSSDAIMMDEEMIMFTTDYMDNSEYYSTSKSDELTSILSNSDLANDLGEMASSDTIIKTVEISAEETRSPDQFHNYNLNNSDDDQTENPKNEKEILDNFYSIG